MAESRLIDRTEHAAEGIAMANSKAELGPEPRPPRVFQNTAAMTDNPHGPPRQVGFSRRALRKVAKPPMPTTRRMRNDRPV